MNNKRYNIRRKFVEEWFDFNPLILFLLLCVLSFIILFLKKAFLINEIAAFEILEERGEMGIFNLFFALEYFVVPVFLGWKITLTTFVLWVGCFLYGYKLTFNTLWKLILLLEIWFLLPELLKVFWFLISGDDPTYWDVRAFYPLSLMNFFDYEVVSQKYHYPLKALNLFEVVYWALMIFGVYWLSGKKLKYAIAIVCSTYVLVFVIWLGYYIGSYS